MSFASVIVVAAGDGVRLGATVRKARVMLQGRTLLDRSIDLFSGLSEVREIVVAVPPEDLSLWSSVEDFPSRRVTAVVAGGATRQESVARALESVAPDTEVIVVHDAARPLTPVPVIREVLDRARRTGAAIAGSPVTDTLKRVAVTSSSSDDGGAVDTRVVETVSREGLFAAQTPQAFRRELLFEAIRSGELTTATDDAMLVERLGRTISVVACRETNLKITTPLDLAMAEAWLGRGGAGAAPARVTRVGLGRDLHRLEPGAVLVLGGVEIPSNKRAVGHSDADVLLHSVTDAILGGAALPDIGALFPDTDPRWRGARSDQFLEKAVELASDCGLEVVQVDAVVGLESPKLGPHRDRIRQRLALLLGLEIECVGLKFKTGEGLGPIGEGRAIDAEAVVVLSGGGRPADQTARGGGDGGRR